MPTVPEMICRALNLEPFTADVSPEKTNCSFCGKPIAAGDPCKKRALSTLGGSFTTDADLACRSNVACKWCPPCMTKTVLMKLSNTVVTCDGLYPVTKDENREWFFRTPPEPPFAAFFVTTKMAHVAWRTPLTLDKEFIQCRLDDQTLTIRHSVLMSAIDDCHLAGKLLADADQASNVQPKKQKKFFVRNHPFISLDRETYLTSHGQFLPQFDRLANESGEAQQLAQRLSLLTTGELFALATLVKAKPVVAVQPSRLN